MSYLKILKFVCLSFFIVNINAVIKEIRISNDQLARSAFRIKVIKKSGITDLVAPYDSNLFDKNTLSFIAELEYANSEENPHTYYQLSDENDIKVISKRIHASSLNTINIYIMISPEQDKKISDSVDKEYFEKESELDRQDLTSPVSEIYFHEKDNRIYEGFYSE